MIKTLPAQERFLTVTAFLIVVRYICVYCILSQIPAVHSRYYKTRHNFCVTVLRTFIFSFIFSFGSHTHRFPSLPSTPFCTSSSSPLAAALHFQAVCTSPPPRSFQCLRARLSSGCFSIRWLGPARGNSSLPSFVILVFAMMAGYAAAFVVLRIFFAIQQDTSGPNAKPSFTVIS